MKGSVIAIWLVSFFSGGISVVTRMNQHTEEAADAYARKDYAEAIASYRYLLNDLEVDDDHLRLNLAHAYYEAGLLQQATTAYQYLADNPVGHIRSLAHLQLGNISTHTQKYKRALALYKLALKADPANDLARYNYELLKKYLQLHPKEALGEEEAENGQEDSQQAPPPPDEQVEPQPKQNPDAQGNQEAETETQAEADNGESGAAGEMKPSEREQQQSGGREAGSEQGLQLDSPFDSNEKELRQEPEAISEEDQMAQTRRARLRQANMSPEKAKLLLDAMRNAELQYIQQLPKKPSHTPKPNTPNW
ncbi:tetratricopeptide repeat protein [Pontibacter mangrovi]|uniref:Tetratricopeptide repeat protein n=1 Tax=Pontibacter mangrovi TaxID=2589816 RepID=A0A501W5J4_9BACT|nr:tetratricopeptide repeat protein [Pontibacter mangrovi]TPE43354.1 tetratricopeptide repeat protein [Pontibacter mangrovi]